MTTRRYEITMTSGTVLLMEADMAQASAPICYVTESDDVVSTQWQTADARHDETAAAALVMADEIRDGDAIESVEVRP
jgi:hypothetical protein